MKSTLIALAAMTAIATAYYGPKDTGLKSILADDGEGNYNEMPIDDYIKGIVAKFDVQDINSESQGKIKKTKAVQYIIETIVEEKDLDPSITEVKELGPVVEAITADVNYTKANAKSQADKAKEEKEAKDKAAAAEKERKAKEAEVLKVRQDGFVGAVNEGAALALSNFAKEIDDLKEGLPSTIVITTQGASIGEGATDEDVAKSIGLLLGKSHGNVMMNRLLQFTVGDLAEAAVQKGIYPDVSAASKGIAAKLEDSGIVSMKPNTVTAYRQLAVRTPGELRNPNVDPTAYLAISQVNGNPKKQDGESDEAFKTRKETLAADLRGLQKELSDGTIKTRKDVLPKVLEIEYKNGLKERPSGEKEMSVGDNYKTFFLASLALENLVGAFEDAEDDEVQFLGPDGKTIVTVNKQDLELLKQEAYNNLLNIVVKTKKVPAADFVRGYSNKEVDVPMGTDGEGKAITEKQVQKVPVYLPVFFKIETEESSEGASSEGSAVAEQADEKTETKEEAAPEADAKPATKKSGSKK